MFASLLIISGLSTGQLPDLPPSESSNEEATPAAPTKYFIEQLLAETRLGAILDQHNIRIYGWTEMSYNASTARHINFPEGLDYRANEFLLNQNWLHFEKAIDPQKKEFQWGWVTDFILPGSDYRYTMARGLMDNQLTANNGNPLLIGIDPVQLHFQAFLPYWGEGTTLRVGRFSSHCEYEQNQGVDSPFVSRSYVWTFNPFTHTGLWAVTQLNDDWSVGYGAATGSDTFIDAANRLSFIGNIKWAPKDGKSTVTFNTVITNPTYDPAQSFAFYNVYNLIVTHKFTDKWSYVLDAVYSNIKDVPGIGNTDWYGAANYLIYAHNDKCTSTLRAELFEDANGFRTGFKGLYTEVTYGLAYKALDGFILRPSIRYDNNANTSPFEGKPSLFTATIDVIVRW